MSARLPVGAAVNEAFQFGLHRWGAIVRFAWFPLVVCFLVFAGYMTAMVDLSAMSAVDGTQAAPEDLQKVLRAPVPVAIAGALVLTLFCFLLLSGVLASLFRLVALGEERPGLLQLRLDGPAIRVFFAYFIVGALGLAITIVSMAVSAAISGESPEEGLRAIWRLYMFAVQAKAGEQPPPELVNDLLATIQPVLTGWLIALIPTIYLNVKLAPFPAGSAAENRLLLFGSFAMTFGHFWSIIFIYILFVVAMLILLVIFQIVAGILVLLTGVLVAQGGALGAVGGVVALVFAAASIWFQLFMASVQYAIPAIIYRRLKTGA